MVKLHLYFCSSISKVRSMLPSLGHSSPFGIIMYDVDGRTAVFNSLAGSGPIYDFRDPGSIRAGNDFPAISVVQKNLSSASSVDAIQWIMCADCNDDWVVNGACAIGMIGAAPSTFSLPHFPTAEYCTSGNLLSLRLSVRIDNIRLLVCMGSGRPSDLFHCRPNRVCCCLGCYCCKRAYNFAYRAQVFCPSGRSVAPQEGARTS